jgi:5-methyltetrahydrofolate--homocysteine methyltransferase
MRTEIWSPGKRVAIGPDLPVVIIGERINPSGRPKLAAALEAGDMTLVRQEAVRQVAAGAQVLDVNAGISGIDEAAVLVEAVRAVGQVTDAPLCLDSASPKALEAALAVYPGKALVNSVNGEEAKLKEVLPLVARHRAAVVALTMDDQGIPKDVPARLTIAQRIVNEAARLGIPSQDIIVDPLAMSVAADDQAGLVALKALQAIRDQLGLNQTVGASNVSFGLPQRAAVNAVFLAMAVQAGCTCPITDPTVWELRRALLVADLMLGRDEYAMNYITAFRQQAGQD